MSGQYPFLRSLAEVMPPRRKCFISYYRGDKLAVEKFLADFSDVFIAKAIGVGDHDDFIASRDSDYIMGRIRQKYLGDSTVTICLIGSCTHSRKYVDWELKATLRQGQDLPNGLLGILLPPLVGSGHLPPRFSRNYESDAGYAMFMDYPTSKDQLRGWIEEAYSRRVSRASKIDNPRDMHAYNHKCRTCGVTH